MKCGPEICAETIWLEVVAMMLATKRTTIQYVTTSISVALITICKSLVTIRGFLYVFCFGLRISVL